MIGRWPITVKCNLFLYVDDTSLVYQSKNAKDVEKQLNEEFANICVLEKQCLRNQGLTK